jgi:CRISPR-associated protein Cas2
MYYLITYDIQSDKTRLWLSRQLKRIGLKRIQKSVFLGTTKSKLFTELELNLKTRLNAKTDRFCKIKLDSAMWNQIELTGIGNLDTLIPDRSSTLFI